MKPTIRNKLLLGFSGMLLLMSAVAGIASFSVMSLRRSAQQTTRIGDRLNSIAIEIQVHNLEAQRKAKEYFLQRAALGETVARETYLDEADFEIHDMESLAIKAVQISPTPEIKDRFGAIQTTLQQYVPALAAAVSTAQNQAAGEKAAAAFAAYQDAADLLHQRAEDGELAGREVAQTYQLEIEQTSKRSVMFVTVFSVVGLILALTTSFGLARVILIPVAHLRDVAESVSLGNLDVSVHRRSKDEIGDLADSFSRMVTAVKFFRLEAEIVQAEISTGEV